MAIATAGFFAFSTLLGTGYSLLKILSLVAYTLATNVTILFFARRKNSKATKQNLRVIDYFKLCSSLTIIIFLPFYTISLFFGITTEHHYLMIILYISALLFLATAIRSGVEINTNSPLFLKWRKKALAFFTHIAVRFFVSGKVSFAPTSQSPPQSQHSHSPQAPSPTGKHPDDSHGKYRSNQAQQ